MAELAVHKFVVVSNISKENNVKAICVTAAAHGFVVIFIGRNSEHFENYTQLGIQFMNFSLLSECKSFLQSKHIELVGIEIMEDAVSILADPFQLSIAFMPGNEGTGLSRKQKAHCDRFVYIPQYGSGTASLNVNVATSIILHRYQLWSSRFQSTNISETSKSTSSCTSSGIETDLDGKTVIT